MTRLSLNRSRLCLRIITTATLTMMTTVAQATTDRVYVTDRSEDSSPLVARIEANDRDIDTYMLQAEKDYKSGNTLAAIADYTAALKIDPDLAIAYNNRAIAKLKIRDYRGALLDYSQVIRLEPDKAIAYNNRAVVRHQLGDCRGAIGDLVTAAKLFKQQGDIGQYQRTIANLSRFEKLLRNY